MESRQESFSLGAVTHQHMLSQGNLESWGRLLHGEAHAIITAGKSRFHERANAAAAENLGNDYLNRKEDENIKARAHPMEQLRANKAFLDKTWGRQN